MTLAGGTDVRGSESDQGGRINVAGGTLIIAETCRVTDNTAAAGKGGGIFDAGTVTLQGANPPPIVVDTCHENCAGLLAVFGCQTGGRCP
jgi:hypothetical protein